MAKLPKTLFVRQCITANKGLIVKGIVKGCYAGRTELEKLMKDETAEITIGEYQLVRVFKAKNETRIATREPIKPKKRAKLQPPAPDSPSQAEPEGKTKVLHAVCNVETGATTITTIDGTKKRVRHKKEAEKPERDDGADPESKFLYKCVCGYEFDVPITKLNGKIKICPKCMSVQITLTE